MKKTKIICTMGPGVKDEETLLQQAKVDPVHSTTTMASITLIVLPLLPTSACSFILTACR